MSVRPLLTAPDTARALEAVAATAKGELLLCLPGLSPGTPLTRPELRDRGFEDWGDLVAWITRRGVALRMLVADVDPLARPEAHRAAWTRASGFADVVQGGAQILCAAHGHAAGGLRGWRLQRARRAALSGLRGEDRGRLTPVQRAALDRPPPARLVEIGQAFALADGKTCVLGGAPLGAATDGPVATALFIDDTDFGGALRGHFADCWAAARGAGGYSLAAPATPMDLPRRAQSRADLRLIRTLSRPGRGFAPDPLVSDHETALTRMLDAASRHVLIRAPALTYDALAERLVAAARRAAGLHLILLLPRKPASDPWAGTPAALPAGQPLDRVRSAFGDRLALCTDPAPGGLLCLVDDREALVGSPALTPRGLHWNTETSALVRDPAVAGPLMEALGALLPQRPAEREALRRAATWSAALPPPEPGPD